MDNKKPWDWIFSVASAHGQGVSLGAYSVRTGGLPLEMGTLMPEVPKICASIRRRVAPITHSGAAQGMAWPLATSRPHGYVVA